MFSFKLFETHFTSLPISMSALTADVTNNGHGHRRLAGMGQEQGQAYPDTPNGLAYPAGSFRNRPQPRLLPLIHTRQFSPLYLKAFTTRPSNKVLVRE